MEIKRIDKIYHTFCEEVASLHRWEFKYLAQRVVNITIERTLRITNKKKFLYKPQRNPSHI